MGSVLSDTFCRGLACTSVIILALGCVERGDIVNISIYIYNNQSGTCTHEKAGNTR